ncbi:hypothetical protein BCR39DRAFT_82321 [Naematelia encephala]|uniref:Uncharacterized protein n=1 Tax=Naematelia encephala TaxID=71784 RepID=A0A1Y2BCN3_9TREE|nr:hypothetical protein BCR39DRAFT_82321 [Naematelia encephala]
MLFYFSNSTNPFTSNKRDYCTNVSSRCLTLLIPILSTKLNDIFDCTSSYTRIYRAGPDISICDYALTSFSSLFDRITPSSTTIFTFSSHLVTLSFTTIQLSPSPSLILIPLAARQAPLETLDVPFISRLESKSVIPLLSQLDPSKNPQSSFSIRVSLIADVKEDLTD